jgi:hypothetical protein
MGLFIVFFWLSDVMGDLRADISRLARFNYANLPFCSATGIGWQGLDLP